MSITSVSAKYVCRACHKHFMREHAFMAHECTQLKREKEIKTPTGQAAWNYYTTWMRKQHKLPPPIDTFLTSKYYRTFITFAEFVRKVQLPLPDKFIWYMVTRNYPPSLWKHDDVYDLYINFIDMTLSPMSQVTASIDMILKITDACEVDPSEFFTLLTPNEVIQLVRTRKISPWLLLFSKKFVEFFSNMNLEQQRILEAIIQPSEWDDRKKKFETEVQTIKLYIQELGL